MEQVAKTNRFTSFVGKSIKSGAKVSGSLYPTLTLTSVKDKFILDQKAMSLLGVDTGSYVVLIDANKGRVETTDENARFFITPSWKDAKNQPVGAKIGKGGSFSYASIYGAMQINDPAISEASEQAMVEREKGRIYETATGKEAFVATNKVTYRLEQYTIEEDGETITKFPVAEGVEQEVYMLVGRTEIEHETNVGLVDDSSTEE